MRSSFAPTRCASRTARSRSRSEVDAEFERGLGLIRSGEYFAAHEALETAWRRAEADERDFFQGLVHVAVAWYQAGCGNCTGCERQLEKARRRLAPYAPSHRGLGLEALLRQLAEVKPLDLPRPKV